MISTLPIVVRVMKSIRMSWGHMARMGAKRGANKVLMGDT